MSSNGFEWPHTPNPLGSHPPRLSESYTSSLRRLGKPSSTNSRQERLDDLPWYNETSEWPIPRRSPASSTISVLEEKRLQAKIPNWWKKRRYIIVAIVVCALIAGLAAGTVIKHNQDKATSRTLSTSDLTSQQHLSTATRSHTQNYVASTTSVTSGSIQITTILTSVERTVTLHRTTLSTVLSNSLSTVTMKETHWLTPGIPETSTGVPWKINTVILTTEVTPSEAVLETTTSATSRSPLGSETAVSFVTTKSSDSSTWSGLPTFGASSIPTSEFVYGWFGGVPTTSLCRPAETALPTQSTRATTVSQSVGHGNMHIFDSNRSGFVEPSRLAVRKEGLRHKVLHDQ